MALAFRSRSSEHSKVFPFRSEAVGIIVRALMESTEECFFAHEKLPPPGILQ